MTLSEALEADLRGLVGEMEENDVFDPGEAEAWYESIEEAEHVSDLMRVTEALHDVLDDRDGVDEARDEHIHGETSVFV